MAYFSICGAAAAASSSISAQLELGDVVILQSRALLKFGGVAVAAQKRPVAVPTPYYYEFLSFGWASCQAHALTHSVSRVLLNSKANLSSLPTTYFNYLMDGCENRWFKQGTRYRASMVTSRIV